MTPVRVSDVRQWAFCPRVIWHRRVMGISTKPTPTMEWGKAAEEALRRKETRRRLRRYGLEDATRAFSVALEDCERRVSGVCDLVLTTEERTESWPRFKGGLPDGVCPVRLHVAKRAYPVEVKRTAGGVRRHHVLQLAGYAELLEHNGYGKVDSGYVLLLPEDRIERVRLGSDEREAFWNAVRAIRDMMESDRFPQATRYRSFCGDCEFVNYCGDVG